MLEAIQRGRGTTTASPHRRERVLSEEAGDEGGGVAPKIAVAPAIAAAELMPLIPEGAAR